MIKELKFDISLAELQRNFNIKSTNTFHSIYDNKSYQDCILNYNKLSKEEKITIMHHYMETYRSKTP